MPVDPLVASIGGGVVGLGTEYLKGRLAALEASKARREVRRINKSARTQYEQERERFLGLETSQLGLDFLKSAFTDPLGGGFGEEFANRLRQASAARGFGEGGGGAGGAQEAAFLTRLADQRRQQLIPMLNIFEQQAQQAGQGAFERRFSAASIIAGLPRVPGPLGGAIEGGVKGGLAGLLLALNQTAPDMTQAQALGAQSSLQNTIFKQLVGSGLGGPLDIAIKNYKQSGDPTGLYSPANLGDVYGF